jgi:hypothetical protein
MAQRCGDQVEHAVQRAVEPAGHVAGDIDHRQQVLVVDGVLALWWR